MEACEVAMADDRLDQYFAEMEKNGQALKVFLANAIVTLGAMQNIFILIQKDLVEKAKELNKHG